MGEYLIISREKLEGLKAGMSGGADRHPRTFGHGIPVGAVRALRKVDKDAELEITEEEFQLILDFLHRREGEKGNGGFVNEGE